MCDLQWDPLADLYLRAEEWTCDVYCLCSRAFVRNKDDKVRVSTVGDDLSASESELCKEEDAADSAPDELGTFHLLNNEKHDGDVEAVSCYCSASHTDNISTDEHDSLRDSQSARLVGATTTHRAGLQSSDSGADLTEHVRNDPDAAWNKYWTNHGERIIWNSWITKYSDYINPDYLAHEEPKEDAKTRFSFDRRDVEPRKIDENRSLHRSECRSLDGLHKNRTLARNLSGSDSYDRLNNADISEGWNPLSPSSVDAVDEAERLLSSRCGSYAGGSVRTVDSMTNVTRMTISSIELSDSSSSKNSDSFSSVSSVQSSLSSTSSEDADENYDAQWNSLWKKHYEDEYLEQYQKFMLRQPGDVDFIATTAREHRNSNNSSVDESETSRRSSKGRRGAPKASIEQLFGGCRMDEPRPEESTNRSTSIEEEMQECGDHEALIALGLPTAFGKQKARRTSIVTKQSRSQDYDRTDGASDRIKAAFTLMGIGLDEGRELKLVGQVDYKMKHIRLQNRFLTLHRKNDGGAADRPKHIFFDDDGNEIADEKEQDEVMLQSSKTDLSENKLSSSSNEDDIEYSKLPSSALENKQDSPDAEPAGSRKRRRKRKLALPSEIKENPKLRKYWMRRFSLFNKFDMGIKLDEESWYSVTPEQVAKHTAQRCKCDVIVDAFCGAGGNSIQFAMTCERVIAIDVDSKKIELARNNAEVYGVADRIDFVVGDFFKLAGSLRADVVFLSPPWGGPAYLSSSAYDLEEMLQPVSLTELLAAGRTISRNVALFLPKNSNTYPLLKAAGQGGQVEIEQNFINKKLIAVTAYYNDLIKRI